MAKSNVEAPAKPADPEFDLASAVRRVSEGMSMLLRSGLNRRAIVVLLKAETGISARDIDLVLDGLGDLSRRYTSGK